ncbi:HAD family hydrolase [Alteromonas antoniana]|uniref:HAD family hydrolase n=1 Tax=Alteromonas antoniana TaxID=2803813 RepID=UPI001C48F50C|nr:HAD family phosphatase [Alteromonas antoniana]
MALTKTVTSATTVILFDHDGTLIDSEATHYRLWQEVLAPYDITLSENFYSAEMAGIPVNQNAKDVVRHFGMKVEPQVLADAKHEKTRLFLQSQAFPLMPFAKETVKACAEAGYTLGIVTGGSGLSVKRTLETYELAQYIKTVVAAEDVEHSKPAPDCYLKAAAHLNMTSEQCIAVEDTQHGLEAAINAGMRCVVIPTSHSEKHDFRTASSQYSSLQEWVEAEIISH